MKKTVLLVNPPTGIYDRSDRCQAPIEEEGIEMIRPPMDLAYLAAMVEKVGGKAFIKDYPAERKGSKEFDMDFREIKPDILVLSVTSPTLLLDLKYCTLAKKLDHKVLTIAKGAHFYEFDREVLFKYPDLDVVIRGEAELVMEEIVRGKRFGEIKGLSFRKGRKIVRNEERPFLDNLDSLPLPARHLLKNELYCFPDTGVPYALIMSGRGCPGDCIFCLVGKVSGRKLRVRSVQSIVDEVENCIKEFNIKTFFFRADTFTWRKDWVLQFCEELIRRNLRIRWGTNSRVDTIDEERILMMKRAGCDIIGLGVESGNKELLRKMGKRVSLADSRRAVRLCEKYRIKTLLFFIIGLPWDNKITIKETIDFAKELPGTFYNFSIAYPFPGTRLAQIVEEKHLLIKPSLSGYDYARPVVKTFSLSNNELVYYRKEALKSVYYRPTYIFRVLKNIRSFAELKNYLKQGVVKSLKLVNPFINDG